jgi:TetR/AcrR family transcriptional regulator
MNTTPNTITASRGSRRQPEASRSAILAAALAEFAEQGLAGARMDAIASAAGVNKALLYYYFQSKDALYGAVLDEFFLRLRGRIAEALDSDRPAGEKILRYARAHFDSVAESPYYARLFQGEMMSAGRSGSPHLSRIVREYISPIAQSVMGVLREGTRSGVFRAVDPSQFAPTVAASIVHYFAVSPVLRHLRGEDPYTPQAIAKRRAAVLDFIAAALFANRDGGVKLAGEIAACPPEGQPAGKSAVPRQRTGARGRRR